MKSRSLGLSFIAVVATLWLFAPTARAQSADEAKRHFTNGVHLFEDRNFAGALVEFEASFKQNPTAAALQNIAVCQKGLFRYAEAIATLERLLKDFGPQLSADDKKAAEDAMHEMSALIGTIVVKITPSDARVTINDTPLAPDAVKSPVKLAAGEYRIGAEAPGFARQEQRVNVTAGQKDTPVVITLTPLSGTIAIHAHDSQAAISLDGTQVGYDEWKGPASAGSHEVYVYTQTQRHKSTVVVYAGQTTELEAKLTAEDTVPTGQGAAASGPPPYVPPSQHGIYGFITFGVDTLGSTAPHGLNQEKARTAGGNGGIAFGYRFSTGFAAEFDAFNSQHDIRACIQTMTNCSNGQGTYHIASSHVGPAARFMTNGRKGRFVGTIAAGAAVQSISYDEHFTGPPVRLPSSESSVGSYLLLGGSYELNLGHFLLDAGLSILGESGDNQKGIKSSGAFGLDFRVGYGQW
jgi:hypothetical protein